jgi:hypothetical protein
MDAHLDPCIGSLHPHALEGLRLFNAGKYFEAHEALETAWRAEENEIRDLYQGILQAGVFYLHVTQGNYAGAIKVYERSHKRLKIWPEKCRGISVGRLCADLDRALEELRRLGPERIGEFDRGLLRPIQFAPERIYICDRCGAKMIAKQCKITCPNCGNRFDCSDLNIYFD